VDQLQIARILPRAFALELSRRATLFDQSNKRFDRFNKRSIVQTSSSIKRRHRPFSGRGTYVARNAFHNTVREANGQ